MGLMKLFADGGPHVSAPRVVGEIDPDDLTEDAHFTRRERKQEKRQKIKRVNRAKTESFN